MLYKLILFLVIFIYIFSSQVIDMIDESDRSNTNNINEEIYFDKSEVDVFNKKALDNISITDKKIKTWIIKVSFNDQNKDNIKNTLTKNGYDLKSNSKNKYFVIGPFADLVHAKEESAKLKKILGLDNKVSSFVF
tara:strand:+ start:433 stop:837 length:405 start_codon:yes stop_codon:yes gene_type:complete